MQWYEQIIQVLLIGIANGSIIALVALGYTLVYGIIELINFAHGDVFMIGSLIAFALIAPKDVGGFAVFPVTAGTPLPLLIIGIVLTLAVTMTLTAGLNAGIERLAYRPLRHAPKLAPLISAIGMSFVLVNVGVIFAGATQRTVEAVFPTNNLLEAFGITSVSLSWSQVFVGVVTIPLLFALSWFVSTTKQGKAMRATAQDPDAAGLMGV